VSALCRTAWLAAALIVLASLAPCSAYAPTFVSPVLRPARQAGRDGGVHRGSHVATVGRIAARMSNVAQDGAGRVPPKPLAKYTTEPVGTNIPKADSAKWVFPLISFFSVPLSAASAAVVRQTTGEHSPVTGSVLRYPGRTQASTRL
jgi:hypothetical protein